ncbi:MAG TPA: hypothetical protein ENF52_06170, partial [Chloroflexi bacterium]|nr:hypothetical protein [Chloroflexota bacterium]
MTKRTHCDTISAIPKRINHCTNRRSWCANGNGNICTDTSHPDYTLVIDGTGYTLVPGEGVDPNEVPNQGVGRYHTDEETFFFIEK